MALLRDLIESIAAVANGLMKLTDGRTETKIAEFADHMELERIDNSLWSAFEYALQCINDDRGPADRTSIDDWIDSEKEEDCDDFNESDG